MVSGPLGHRGHPAPSHVVTMVLDLDRDSAATPHPDMEVGPALRQTQMRGTVLVILGVQVIQSSIITCTYSNLYLKTRFKSNEDKIYRSEIRYKKTLSTLSNYNGLFRSMFWIKLKQSVGLKGLRRLACTTKFIFYKQIIHFEFSFLILQ